MNKIIEAFQGGTLQIDFIELVLVQDTDTDPIAYRGTGYIRQTETDSLTLRLYAVETQNTDFMKDFNSLGTAKPGKLYRDTDYFNLKGRSIDGSVWTAKRLLPQSSWFAGHPNPIVDAAIGHCERGQRSATPTGMRLHYFDKADIPALIDKVKLVACGFNFNVEKAENSFTVEVTSKAQLPDYLEVKIEESLRFLLAQTVRVRAIESSNQYLQLYSRYGSSHLTRLSPPISRGGAAFHDHSWRLFETYLAFVLRDAGAYWHVCSNHLHNACEASANALDAWAIGLGVAVEGLASLLPIELDPTLKTKLEALQQFVNAQVSDSPDHTKFAKRIAGMMNGLTTIRAVDRMNALAENGGTLPKLVKDWTALRNRGVHPTKSGVDPSQVDHQKLIDQVHHVTTLMYHIVFTLIGYEGPCTNYAEHGFPERTYPPEPLDTRGTTEAASPATPAIPPAAAKTTTPAKRNKTSPKRPRATAKPRASATTKARGSSGTKKAKTIKTRRRKGRNSLR